MKERALFHLLMSRVKVLDKHLDAMTKTSLDKFLPTLEVRIVDQTYEVNWTHTGYRHTTRIPIDSFAFYVHNGEQAKRDAAGDEVRGRNWESVTRLWRAIFEQSGLHWPIKGESPHFTFTSCVRCGIGQTVEWSGLPWAVGISAAVGLFSSPLQAVAAGAAAWAIMGLESSLRDGRITVGDTTLNKLIVTVPVLWAALTDVHLCVFAVVAMGLWACCLAERVERNATPCWILGGILLGTGAGCAAHSWHLIVGLFAIGIALLVVFAPTRVPWGAGAAALIPLVLAMILAHQIAGNGPRTLPPPMIDHGSIAIGVALLLTWALWWTFDRMPYLLGWWAMLCFGVGGLWAQVGPPSASQAESLAALIGFVGLTGANLARGLARSFSPPPELAASGQIDSFVETGSP